MKCNLKTSDNLITSNNQCSDPRFSENSSSNSITSSDFDSALEDNFDINCNNVISKNEVNSAINHTSIDSGDDSATISRSETNSNVTVVERTVDKNVDNPHCFDDNNKQIPRTSNTSETVSNNEVRPQVNDVNCNEISNSEVTQENGVESSIKMSKKIFGSAFVPKFQSEEDEPLLVIKRTPSKINLPKEVGKPKVAVNKNIEENARKYFGSPPKTSIRRSSTARNIPRPKVSNKSYFKSSSLNSTLNFSFNFEPEEEDLKNTDDYIEHLLQNQDELLKPIDPNKYLFVNELNEEKKSDSIDDLLDALEMETYDDVFEPSTLKERDHKIEKLLKWMDGVDHQETSIKLPVDKYENLETTLKTEKNSVPTSKLAKNNIKYFDELLSGKNCEAEDEVPRRKFSWARTDVDNHLSQHRTSLDLDAVKKVNIKNVLRKFESLDHDVDDDPSKKNTAQHLEKPRKKPFLTRSKTEIHFDKPRNSVDLDAVSKVDIKQVLKKFENVEKRDIPAYLPRKRSSSFATLKKPTSSTINLETKHSTKRKPYEKPIVQKHNRKDTDISGDLSNNYLGNENNNVPTFSVSKTDTSDDNYFNMQVKVNYEQYTFDNINSCETDTENGLIEGENENEAFESKNENEEISEESSIRKSKTITQLQDNTNHNCENISNSPEENENDFESVLNCENGINIENIVQEESIKSSETDKNEIISIEEQSVSLEDNLKSEIDTSTKESNINVTNQQPTENEEESAYTSNNNCTTEIETKDIDNVEYTNSFVLDDKVGIIPSEDKSEVLRPNFDENKSVTDLIIEEVNSDSYKQLLTCNESDCNIQRNDIGQNNTEVKEDIPRREKYDDEDPQNGISSKNIPTEVKKNDSQNEKEYSSETNKLNIPENTDTIAQDSIEFEKMDITDVIVESQQGLNLMIGSVNEMVPNSDTEVETTSQGGSDEKTIQYNLHSNQQKINNKDADISPEISVLFSNERTSDTVDSEKAVSKQSQYEETVNAPPIPARVKHPIKEMSPPQRPQRKRSLEQRNKESVERTKYVPTEEKLRNLERIKKERITKHQSPKAQKFQHVDLNSSSETKDKECSIQ